MEHYTNILRRTDWSTINFCNNVDIAWTRFKQILTAIIDEVAPNKEIRIKKNRIDPWITNKILHLIDLRDKAARKLKTIMHDDEL